MPRLNCVHTVFGSRHCNNDTNNKSNHGSYRFRNESDSSVTYTPAAVLLLQQSNQNTGVHRRPMCIVNVLYYYKDEIFSALRVFARTTQHFFPLFFFFFFCNTRDRRVVVAVVIIKRVLARGRNVQR